MRESAAEPQGLFWRSHGDTRRGYRPYFENYTVDASIFERSISIHRLAGDRWTSAHIDDLKDH